MNIFNAVNVSHNIIKENLKLDSICIDATCGNGNDTLFLSNLIGEKGYVYAFDIQKSACISTSSLLRRNNITNVKVVCDSHDKICSYIDEKIDCAVFNLGYLPKSESNISTHPKTTIAALNSIISILNTDGFIVICVYVAHGGGMREHSKVLDYCSKLDDNFFQTILIDQPNKKKTAPKVIFINKKVDF